MNFQVARFVSFEHKTLASNSDLNRWHIRAFVKVAVLCLLGFICPDVSYLPTVLRLSLDNQLI